MKKISLFTGFIVATCLLQFLTVQAAPVTPVYGGGTDTSTLPSIGSLLVGANTTTTSYSQYGVLAVGSNGLCLVASSTAQLGVVWQSCGSGGSGSSTVIYGTNGVTVTALVNSAQTSSINEGFSNTWTVPQEFTNINASGTLTIATTTASGTTGYIFSSDGNNFLNLTQFGNTPGSGSTGTLQEYNILEQNCPVGTSTTSGQGECTISQSLTNPYGLTGRVFYDHTLELYAPTYLWGDFITATQSSTLPEYVVEFTDHTNNHAQPFTITPVNSSTNNGFAINLGTSNSTLGVTGNTTITGTERISGDTSVGTTTDNGNLYVSSAGTNVVRLNRGANTNFNLLAFSTAGTDDWNFGEQNNSTNNFVVQDAANGGTVIQAVQNGSTTLGVSGTGKTVISGVAFLASTTLTANQTSTFISGVFIGGNLNVTGTATFASTFTQSGGNVSLATTTISTNLQTQTLNEPIATSSATASTTVINWAQSSIWSVQMNVATTTFVFNNCTNGQKPTLWIWQNATGSETYTFPSSGACAVSWASSTAPTATTIANHGDAYSFQAFAPFSTTTLIMHGEFGPGNFSQ